MQTNITPIQRDDVTFGFPDEYRGISRDTFEKFGVLFKFDKHGKPIECAFPYCGIAKKVRDLNHKSFRWVNYSSECPLFGLDRWTPGCARAVTVVEGEFDALAVYEMMGDYPVVSVQSASTAKRDCQKAFEFLNSFENIYLCFDNDEAGQRAAEEVRSLFDFKKVRLVKLTKHKDANDYLKAGDVGEFKRAWYNAKVYSPDNLLFTLDDFREVLDNVVSKPSVSWPWPKLQEMTYGIRPGEILLFTAQEGIGKTEIFRSIEYHLLRFTDKKIGIIHLEETADRTLKGLAGYVMERPMHINGADTSEVLSAIEKLTNNGERLFIYNHYGSAEPDDIVNIIRYLVSVVECDVVFLDHITMIVSGLLELDERRALDVLSTQLATIVRELDFTLFLVSHENDEGKTRGSRNISKIADLHVRLLRDKEAENTEDRNTTKLLVVKNRFGAETGYADDLWFDTKTFMIRPKEIYDGHVHTPEERKESS